MTAKELMTRAAQACIRGDPDAADMATAALDALRRHGPVRPIRPRRGQSETLRPSEEYRACALPSLRGRTPRRSDNAT